MIPKQGASIRLFSLLRSVIRLKGAFAGVSPCPLRLEYLDSSSEQNSRSSFFNEPHPL